MRLDAIGEFGLHKSVLSGLLEHYNPSAGVGDDCGFYPVSDALTLAVSGDVGPEPLVKQLRGYEDDLESAGWHAALATASDIATSGARPLFMVDLVDAPPETEVDQLTQYIDGYMRAACEFGFATVGGDLRQGSRLSMRTVGVGLVDHPARIGRGGAKPGDKLVLLGPAGKFITSFLTCQAEEHEADEAMIDYLRFPKPQIGAMRLLAGECLVSAASDSSDGVLGAIKNISDASGCGFILSLESIEFGDWLRQPAQSGQYDVWNLFFFWGDWSVAAIIPQELWRRFLEVATELEDWVLLGEATSAPEIVADVASRRSFVSIVRNENFSTLGFNKSLDGHLHYMLNTPIFDEMPEVGF
ncbi:AIR synthase related protein [Gordonia westfalica]|uniref:AIR synthase related protein n=1 Tax=Gordonia westfalica TaxID=158898 RepID=A0ABU2GVK8_9ACTN|nr:AIR synthase related protein [Gordonia westfalica]MDS1115493.1 AIR synthase related protein [Gordonia westfalica]